MVEAIGVAQGEKEEAYGQHQEQNDNFVSWVSRGPGKENTQVNRVAQKKSDV